MKINWNIVGAVGSLVIGMGSLAVGIVSATNQAKNADKVAQIQGYYAGVGYADRQRQYEENPQQEEQVEQKKKKFIPS